MPLTLTGGDSLTEDTLICNWTIAVGEYFQDEDLGKNLCTVFTSRGIRSLGSLRSRTRTEVRDLLAGAENLGVYLLEDLEKLARYSIADAFNFAANDDDDHIDKKPKWTKGGGTISSFSQYRSEFPEGYDESRDIQLLPQIITNKLPTKKQLGVKDGLPQVTSAIVAFMFLKYKAVHYCHADEGDLVRRTACRIAKLIVERGFTVITGTKKTQAEVEGAPAVARIVEAIRNKMVQTKQMVREAKSPDEYPSAKKPRLVFKITSSEHERCKELLEAGFDVAYQVNEYLVQDHSLDTITATIAEAPPAQPSPLQPQSPLLPQVLQGAAAAAAGPWGDAKVATGCTFNFGGGTARSPHVAPPEPPPPTAEAAAATGGGSKRRARMPKAAKNGKVAEQAEQAKAGAPAEQAKAGAPAKAAAEDAALFGEGLPFNESDLSKSKRLTMLPKTEVDELSRTNKDMLDFKGYGAKDIRVAVLWAME